MMRNRRRRVAFVSLLIAALGSIVALRSSREGTRRTDAIGGPSGSVAAREAHSANAGRARHGASSSGPGTVGAIDPGSLPFDLGAVMQQVHFAYRPTEEAGRFTGGHTTYAVEVDPRGVTLRPYGETKPRRGRRSTIAPESTEVGAGAPLRLEVAGIERGGEALANARAGDARVEDDGHLAIARGAVNETYRNRDEGVEQSWAFDREPTGNGELRVRMRASGLRYVGETASGLHFEDPRTGLGFRYGNGTWVDARGDETRVAARYVAGGIELVVPSDVLASSRYPAVLDPTISPELELDAPLAGILAWGTQYTPRVASNGTDFLVVWTDHRASTSAFSFDIFGTRVTSAGVVSDPTGIPISTPVGNQMTPSVASIGSDYFVVWQDNRDSTTPYASIYGARVTSAGTVSDPGGIAIATGGTNQRSAPTVASNGTEYLVAWTETHTDDDIYGARVTSAGVVSDTTAIAISTAANLQGSASAASVGSDFLVVWQDARVAAGTFDVYGSRVSSAGSVLDSSGLAISGAAGDQTVPSLASDGTQYLVVFQNTNGGASDIYGRRVASDGTLLDASDVAVSIDPSNQANPSVATNGSGFLVAWEDTRNAVTGTDVYGTTVTSGGAVADATNGFAISTATGTQTSPTLAASGTVYLAAWTDMRGASSDIYGARVTGAGSVSDPSGIAISTSADEESAPSIAWNGTDYLVAWQDYEGADTDILGAQVTSAGALTSPSGIAISTSAGMQQAPSVTSKGSDYMVVWQDSRNGNWDIYGTWVTSAGSVVDTTGTVISNDPAPQFYPSVASNGTDYFVAWEDYRSALTYDVYGTPVTSSGVADPAGMVISNATSNQMYPSVASNGTDYLVVWSDMRNGLFDVYGTRVSGGVVTDTSGLAISTAAAVQANATVASNGTDYLVVWQDGRNADWDIYGTSVSSAGVVSSPTGLAIANTTGVQELPRVASNGTDYLVAWQDLRSRTTYDVYGTRVRSGVVESPAGIAFAADAATNERVPSVAGGAPRSFLLSYERFLTGSPYGATRARARLVSYGSDLGQTCANDADCESGFCIDGVCCDSACGGGANDCQACSIALGAATDGTCAPTTGNACNDGLGCTSSDTCNAGTCAGTGNPCSSGTTCSEAGGGTYACSACPAGTYSADGTGMTACTPCAPGTFSMAGATSCTPWTDCQPGQAVFTDGSSTYDRVCAACGTGWYTTTVNAASCTAWTTCVPGAYVSTSGTSSSDQVCTACALGTYSTVADASSCTAWTDCNPGQMVSVPGSSTTDRVCGDCGPGTFSTITNATSCDPWTTCPAGTYVATSGTTSSDQVCSPCPTGTFAGQPNLTSCTPYSPNYDCPAGYYVSAQGTSTSPPQCTACSAGTFSTTTNAASCVAWSACPAGTYFVAAGSTTSDTTCAPCGTNQYSTTTNATSCTWWSVCHPGSYVSIAGTSSSDLVCAACPTGTYSTVDDANACTAWTDCVPGQMVVEAASSTIDRVCGDCAPGFMSTTKNATSCDPWSTCPAGTYVSTQGTTSSDRVCSPCPTGTFAAGSNQPYCTPFSPNYDCPAGYYVSAQGTATSAPQCTACSAGTFSSTTNAASCVAWSACPAGTYFVAAGSTTSDTTCAPCAAGEFSSTTNASSCTAWTTCTASEYASVAPTASSDRVCMACTACAAGTIETTACSATADTVCTPVGDAGVDGGTSLDAGAIGNPGTDAGANNDAGSDAGADGSANDDGGTGDASTSSAQLRGGCGCSTAAASRSPSPLSVLALVALLGAAARRRRRTPSDDDP